MLLKQIKTDIKFKWQFKTNLTETYIGITNIHAVKHSLLYRYNKRLWTYSFYFLFYSTVYPSLTIFANEKMQSPLQSGFFQRETSEILLNKYIWENKKSSPTKTDKNWRINSPAHKQTKGNIFETLTNRIKKKPSISLSEDTLHPWQLAFFIGKKQEILVIYFMRLSKWEKIQEGRYPPAPPPQKKKKERIINQKLSF